MNNMNSMNIMNIMNSKELTSTDREVLSSIDFVNLKIASRPVKHYKLLHCLKSKIHDYSYILEKIQLHAGITPNNPQFVFFLKSTSRDEIKISNEEDWRTHFERNDKSIIEFIDSKNTLKIEYVMLHNTPEERLRTIYMTNEKFSFDVLKSVFKFAQKSEAIKEKIKEDLLSENGVLTKEHAEDAIKGKAFDVILNEIFNKTLKSVYEVYKMKMSLGNVLAENDKSEILFDQSEDNFRDDKADKGDIGDSCDNCYVPPFSEFFKNEQIENFRSKILSQTFAYSEAKK